MGSPARRLMILIASIAVAIRALLTNKLRSLLTMLGITIGIAAVLAMVAIGDGAKTIILEDLEKISGISELTDITDFSPS